MTGLIGGLLLAVGVALFILEPVFSGQRAPIYDGDDDFDDASARRRVALTALRDLEYDRVTGKVNDRDYALLKDELSREALRHLASQEAASEGVTLIGEGEAYLEAEIARIRVAIQQGMECSACGVVNRGQSQFCGSCGGSLQVKDAPAASS